MYLPAAFEVRDRDALLDVMRANPFATVITVRDGVPDVAHLPLLTDLPEGGDRVRIRGHLARANPMREALEGAAALTAVFHGPHAYVSPRIYVTAQNVPTWNYVAVHATGRPRVLDARDSLALLHEQVRAFESDASEPWDPARAGPGYVERLVPGIVAFELQVETLEGKFKLNQNRRPEDRARVVETFSASERPEERAVAAWMRRLGPP